MKKAGLKAVNGRGIFFPFVFIGVPQSLTRRMPFSCMGQESSVKYARAHVSPGDLWELSVRFVEMGELVEKALSLQDEWHKQVALPCLWNSRGLGRKVVSLFEEFGRIWTFNARVGCEKSRAFFFRLGHTTGDTCIPFHAYRTEG